MKNRALLFVSAFAAVFASVFFYAHSVSADYGLSATAGAAGLSQERDVAGIIGNVIGAGLSLVTVLFFILMIYGGIRWMMARGKEEESKKALDTIIAAIIGIIIVLASYAITNFVFKSVGTAAGGGGGTPTAPKDPGTPNDPGTPGDTPKAEPGQCNNSANAIDFCALNETEEECNTEEDCDFSIGSCTPKFNCNGLDNKKEECGKQPAYCTWVPS